jgi:hypothetical protein
VALVMAVALPGAAMAQAAKPAQPAPKAGQPAATDSRSLNLKAYVELMRSDLRTQKIALITEVMEFTEAEDQAFWPVYRDYESKLARINDERLRGIETYAKSYNALTDATANDLMTKALDLEARRVALKQEYFNKLKAVMSPLTAARALQVENQILLLIDLQVAASLPVAEK